jgi:hypothetical protein
MHRLTSILLAGGLVLAAAPALAADLTEPEAVAAPPAPTPTWTFGFEATPEWFAIDNGSNRAGWYNDTYLKASLSHSFGGGFVGGISFQDTLKQAGASSYQIEGTLGYKVKLTDTFTLTPGIGIGYVFGETGIHRGLDANYDQAYWLVTLAGDLKIAPKWTWNVFNARWRDGFSADWQTPKVTTGLTYSITQTDAVYFNVGYSWKKLQDVGAPYDSLDGDKWNLSLGYKHSF